MLFRSDVDVENRELHDTGWEDDLVTRWVVVSVDGWHGHIPLIPVNRFSQGGPHLGNLEAVHRNGVLEESGRIDLHWGVVVLDLVGVQDVRTLIRITDLLDDVVDFVDG